MKQVYRLIGGRAVLIARTGRQRWAYRIVLAQLRMAEGWRG